MLHSSRFINPKLALYQAAFLEIKFRILKTFSLAGGKRQAEYVRRKGWRGRIVTSWDVGV